MSPNLLRNSGMSEILEDLIEFRTKQCVDKTLHILFGRVRWIKCESQITFTIKLVNNSQASGNRLSLTDKVKSKLPEIFTIQLTQKNISRYHQPHLNNWNKCAVQIFRKYGTKKYPLILKYFKKQPLLVYIRSIFYSSTDPIYVMSQIATRVEIPGICKIIWWYFVEFQLVTASLI